MRMQSQSSMTPHSSACGHGQYPRLRVSGDLTWGRGRRGGGPRLLVLMESVESAELLGALSSLQQGPKFPASS
ncbi:hypothetical protein Mapa_015594 [Marchantia paleacea]|nr:hypothetical protein Mapa_015594 [Marchantia paleacea]